MFPEHLCAYQGRDYASLLRLDASPSLGIGLGIASLFSSAEENMLRRSSPGREQCRLLA